MKKTKSSLRLAGLALAAAAVPLAASIALACSSKPAQAAAEGTSSASESSTMYLAASTDGVKLDSISVTRGTSDDGKLTSNYFLINAPAATTNYLIKAVTSNPTQDGFSLDTAASAGNGAWKLTFSAEPYSRESYCSVSSTMIIYAMVGEQKANEAEKISVGVTFSNPGVTVADQIKSLLDKQVVLVSIFTACAIVLMRTGLRVFRFGVSYKSNFVTVEDNEKFKNEIREDSRASKADMQDSILKICLREIARDTKPVSEMQQIAQDMKTSKEKLDIQIQTLQSKYNDMQSVASELHSLETTVRSIQYGETSSGERRSGK